MITCQGNKNNLFYAISYDTFTFGDLEFYLKQCGVSLHRIDPDVFMTSGHDPTANYINLVTKDLNQREKISKTLDSKQLHRFSFVHPSSVTEGATVGIGSFVYPLVSLYPNSSLGSDNVIHSYCLLPHNSSTGQGCFFSGSVIVGGSTRIGDYCVFGLGATIYDKLIIASKCHFGSRVIVRKNVTVSGRYGLGKDNKLLNLR